MFFTCLEPWVVEQAPRVPAALRDGSLAPPAAHATLVLVADLALAGGLLLLLGAIARKRLLPAGAAIAALAGGLLAVGGGYVHEVVGTLGVILFGAAIMWIGLGMWRADGAVTATRAATALDREDRRLVVPARETIRERLAVQSSRSRREPSRTIASRSVAT